MTGRASVDLSCLYCLPCGAGGHSVRLSGKAFEALASRPERRPPCDLDHSALVVRLGDDEVVVEQAPDRGGDGAERRELACHPVGTRAAGRLRLSRYEVRCSPGSAIPDLAEAAESPRHLTESPAVARWLLELVATVPTPVPGRDGLETGETLSASSTISWLLAASGLPAWTIAPPRGGRAPGGHAGVVAERQAARSD
jgi:hypothetical protein